MPSTIDCHRKPKAPRWTHISCHRSTSWSHSAAHSQSATDRAVRRCVPSRPLSPGLGVGDVREIVKSDHAMACFSGACIFRRFARAVAAGACILTGTLQMRKDFSTSATSMGNELSLTKSFGMVQVSKGTVERIPAQIPKSLKTPNKLRTKFSHRICDTETLPRRMSHPPHGDSCAPALTLRH